MQVEIKNVKHSEFASHETDCFEASVWIDGKKAGTVENCGQGGPNFYHPSGLEDVLNAYAKTLPPTEYECDGESRTIEQDADVMIGYLLTKHLQAKRDKSLCRGKTVYRIPGHHYNDGEWHVIKKPFEMNIKMFLIGRHGAETQFLNEQI